MKKASCYIDGRICSGGRFYFCLDCLKAQQQNAEQIKNAKTPAELTAAHCLPKESAENEI